MPICRRPTTPDGRPGCRVMIFAVSTDELQKQLLSRVGQCVLTTPGSACFAGIDGANRLKLGAALRYFGDGYQISKKLGGRHFWRIPVMDGEFVCEATTGMTKAAVGGGNLMLLGRDECRRSGGGRSRGRGHRPRAPARSCRSRAASCARAPRSAANTGA